MKARLLMFLLGLVLGGTGAIFLPRLLEPLLPAGLRSEGEAVEGTVIRRQRDGERLLLTINTPQGASLATFTEKVAEIDLLVEAGDAVTLGLGAYEPFVDNPPIRAVRKGDTPAVYQEPMDAASAPAMDEATGDEPASGESIEEAPDAEAELEAWPGVEDAGAKPLE